jgi:hypothetical protein
VSISAAEARELLAPQSRGRFRRSAPGRRTVDGILFDSIGEALRYMALKNLQRAGKISDLRRQQSYQIEIKGHKFCKFKPDFEYITEEGQQVIEEVKSSGTAKDPSYRLRKKAFELYYGLTVTEIISK